MLNPSPSSPARPPIEHLYFLCRDEEDQEVFFITQGFSALYAVTHWLEAILEANATPNWIDDNKVVLTHDNGHTLTIRGSHLSDALEAKLTKEETRWTPPNNESRSINKLLHFYKDTAPKPYSKPSTPAPAPTTSRTPSVSKRHKTQKTVEGMITVAQMAETLNMQPNKARQALRKAKVTKPTNGWNYKEGSKEAQAILKILSDSR